MTMPMPQPATNDAAAQPNEMPIAHASCCVISVSNHGEERSEESLAQPCPLYSDHHLPTDAIGRWFSHTSKVMFMRAS